MAFHHQVENLCSPKDYPTKQTHSPICKEIFYIYDYGSCGGFFDGQIRDHGMFKQNFVLSNVFPQMMPKEMLVGR